MARKVGWVRHHRQFLEEAFGELKASRNKSTQRRHGLEMSPVPEDHVVYTKGGRRSSLDTIIHLYRTRVVDILLDGGEVG